MRVSEEETDGENPLRTKTQSGDSSHKPHAGTLCTLKKHFLFLFQQRPKVASQSLHAEY